MNSLVLVSCVAVLSTSVFAQEVSPVVFGKDVKQHVTVAADTKVVAARVTIDADSITVAQNIRDTLTVPFSAITSITYDRRRRASQFRPQAMPPRQQHMLTIRYKTGAIGDFIELELEKDIAPRLINTLEARSGKPIEKIVG